MSFTERFERALLRTLSPAGARARLLILTYHRVLAAPDPLLDGEPDAAQFTREIEVLSQYCRVLPLPEAIERLQSDCLPPCAACITFDDGYANNLTVALPILEQRGLTATIFMATDAIRRGVMWNDLVIESVRAAHLKLDLSPLGKPPLELADAARPALIAGLLSEMKYMPLADRWQRALELFAKNAGGSHPRLMLSDAQVAQIAARGHDVGAHTINHPILRELPPDEARAEITASRRWLAEVIGQAPRSFAYPNGRPNLDYDREHVAMVREAGFDLAVSTSWGCATRRSDKYQLPRCTSWELSSRWFPARLAKNYLMHAD